MEKSKTKSIEKAIKTLEFDKIRERLAELCPTEGAKEIARALSPSKGVATVRRILAETDAACALELKKGMPPFYGVRDITSTVDRADKGAVLGCGEILSVLNVLKAARALREYGATDEPNALTEYFERLTSFPRLEAKIEKCVQSDEGLYDTASDELYDIRRKIMRANAKIRESLQKMITGASSKYLQEQIITMRDGRYVVPVKSEYKNEVKGLVHDTSASGATLFIEPLTVVEGNNELRLLEKADRDECERILSELSADIAANAHDIILNYRNTTLIAFEFGKCRLSLDYDGISPEITEERRITLNKARHPLLDKDKVVPITVGLGKDFDTLIITGPNTGGKTVTLKTLGLFALMAQSGLRIPASDGSAMCVFDDILADIGDEQSIEQSLSTFSSHMVNIVDITQRAGERALVLFDELGAGTDPVEGAALAVSILEAVREKGALIAATTHYSELKSYAIETDGVMNASCEFDIETLRPTYKLVVGTPGKSNAFAISRKLGLDEAIIERANSYVSGENRRFENVIESLENERVEMEKRRAEAERLLREAKEKKEKAEAAAAKKEDEAERTLEKARATAVRMIEGAKASSEFVFAELEKVKKAKESERIAEELDEARRAIKSHLKEKSDVLDPVEKRDTTGYVLPRPLVVGDEVIIVSINKKGVVRETDGKTVTVVAGNMTMKLKPDALMLIDGEDVTYREKPQKKTHAGGDREIRSMSGEIDLRGQYGDDACFMLDKFIDEAKMSGLGEIRVIHGKGTGALRKAVTAFLKADQRIKSTRIGGLGEGDTGVTVAELK
ncbi:MAG: endonuclease MutS2 [Clostridia bacterium]|nr:endonuclease MutS2 [Clostridia bacterium]